MKKIILFVSIIFIFTACKTTQTIKKPSSNLSRQLLTEPEKRGYWQQRVKYFITANLDTAKNQYKGKIKLIYYNNSKDTLKKAFFHLYWNAFQPGSAMDWRNRTLEDPDRNLDKTIQNLKPDEIGFVQINKLLQNNQKLNYKIVGTIMKVDLNEPIFPGDSTVFHLDYLTQIPKLLRRSGRDNKEGIDYSMAQWYPQICEYDLQGWHTDPYLGREFYNVWGDFDVKLKVPANYMVAASGYLQNPEEIVKNYPMNKPLNIPKTGKLTWHFYAPNVHDFVWAADPDYIHDIAKTSDGITLHFFYQKNPETIENWTKLKPFAIKTMEFYNEYIGKYPYKKYNIIQAGDGGMEYAMGTFVLGDKSFNSLRGTVQHEMGHAWFQFALANNEAQYPWMDEGFTSYIQDMANLIVNGNKGSDLFQSSYNSYRYLVHQGKDEPLSTHSDHYTTNLAYWIGAYDKGKLVLTQLSYIMGGKKLRKTLQEYYAQWKMKHPQPDDFFKIAQKISGMDLRIFKNDWIETTHHIDYAIDKVVSEGQKTKIKLKRLDEMGMPLDIFVQDTSGNLYYYYIPLDLLRNTKENPYPNLTQNIMPVWEWAIPQYEFTIDIPLEKLDFISIDPFGYMADINPENNVYKRNENKK